VQAHRLKNDATLTNRALDSLPCKRRVLLSGTPMQNHLDEVGGGIQGPCSVENFSALAGPLLQPLLQPLLPLLQLLVGRLRRTKTVRLCVGCPGLLSYSCTARVFGGCCLTAAPQYESWGRQQSFIQS
jgi:hypothetical protein